MNQNGDFFWRRRRQERGAGAGRGAGRGGGGGWGGGVRAPQGVVGGGRGLRARHPPPHRPVRGVRVGNAAERGLPRGPARGAAGGLPAAPSGTAAGAGAGAGALGAGRGVRAAQAARRAAHMRAPAPPTFDSFTVGGRGRTLAVFLRPLRDGEERPGGRGPVGPTPPRPPAPGPRLAGRGRLGLQCEVASYAAP